MCCTTEIGDCSLARRGKVNLLFVPGEFELEALGKVLPGHAEHRNKSGRKMPV
jgi:hypothetical protein